MKIRFALIPLGVMGLLVLFLELQRRPGYFANSTYIGAILAVEIVLACLWRFEKIFFPATLWCFLSASTALPFGAESYTVRWIFLGVGSLAGLIIWMRSSRAQHFGLFHLVALFCVLSALASASASDVPMTALLKVMSLFLLFLYAATGGRVALAGREKPFVRGLVLASEISVFVVSACYFVGLNLFGNQNNLGAFVGVVAVPILVWAALVAEDRTERQRRYAALALCGVLLYVTVCRAAIVADVIVVIVATIALRRPRLLLRAAFAGALFLELMAVANPSHMSELMDSLSGRFIFKIDEHRTKGGVFGSRETPWDDTIAAVKQHPYFGTGFGTSDIGMETPGLEQSSIYTIEGSNREHGSSYLAMAEYMGLLGILPFLFLMVLLIRAAIRAYSWVRRTGNPNHYAVPFAFVIIAGLIHAGFEDWLFAAGSYLCLFFWVLAFMLIDLTSDVKADQRISATESFPGYAQAQHFRQPTT